MGISKWGRKDQLIERILKASELSKPNVVHTTRPAVSTQDDTQLDPPSLTAPEASETHQATTAHTPHFDAHHLVQQPAAATPQENTPIPDLRLSLLHTEDLWCTDTTQHTPTTENPLSGNENDAASSLSSSGTSNVRQPPLPPSRDDKDTARPPSTQDNNNNNKETQPPITREADTECERMEGMDIFQISLEIRTIKSRLATKDLEIELLNTEVKTAYHTIELLQQRVSKLEKHRCVSKEHGNAAATLQVTQQNETPASNDTPKHQPTTLLLGDTNFKNLRMCDLNRNKCRIRTLHEAKLDLMREWVQEKLSWVPDTCIIYGGIFDLLEDTPVIEIINSLGALVCELKNRNENMDIFVCQLVPSVYNESMQEKISNLNEEFRKWCEMNGISIINPEPAFRLGTGEIEELCYELPGEYQGTLLNRLGATRLISVIGKVNENLKVCVNWDKVKCSDLSKISDKQHSTPAPVRPAHASHHGPDRDGWQVAGSKRHKSGYGQAYHPARTTNTGRVHGQPPRPGVTMTSHTSSTLPPNDGPNNQQRNSSHSTWSASSYKDSRTAGGSHRTYHHDGHHPQPQPQLINRNTVNYRIGCYRCGEFNHKQSMCRYDHKVLCSSCNRYGHKSRLCNHYSA